MEFRGASTPAIVPLDDGVSNSPALIAKIPES
jgi:hypothetical protein